MSDPRPTRSSDGLIGRGSRLSRSTSDSVTHRVSARQQNRWRQVGRLGSFAAMVVHSVLPEGLTDAVTAVLRPAGITHCAHGYHAPMWGAGVAAGDPEAVAVIGPYR